ncbi:hypothetical protein C8F04DRAFT_1391345 [Mycena alexandri]|uniref:Uncharacterized protein n=1 Tax=Mycena alexandri TaxID=1745969 RepID=A0AAD6TC59_9AGAR|nr:hypothetical protein C8F04DRAFT_1391345 [Mycena alexandri]
MILPTRTELDIAEYGKREAPRIGGSEGGFIGLVVGLVVIILISCVAIFILLRNHSPSERDRETRRHEARYPSESSLKDRIPWSGTLGGIFGRGAGGTADASKRASKSGHGWIQASGDAWEADEAERSREMSGFVNAKRDAPFSPPVDPYAAESYSSDSIAYDPPISHSHVRFQEPIPRSASPESMVPHMSPTQKENRQFSGESTTSIRTFEGGTKFIEGL